MLLLAYPDAAADVRSTSGQVFLVMRSGLQILYDDRLAKGDDALLADADLQDTLAVIYPLADNHTLEPAGFDPGRARCYPLISAIYGGSEAAVRDNLVTVAYGAQRLPFSQSASAAIALKRAADKVAELVAGDPAIGDSAYPSAGTFNYRVIAGTDRLSPHAFGMAIDLRSYSDGYWRWADAVAGEARIKAYPAALVRAFEENGFIWGGKWHHFDLYHFEYRPELLIKARYFADGPQTGQPWYYGADLDDSRVQEAVQLIDTRLP